MTITKLSSFVAAASLALLGATAQAQTWNFGSTNTAASCAQSAAGCTSSTGSLNVKVSAWSTTTSTPTTKMIGATITDQDGSGIGITSSADVSGSPNHAIDSSGQDELILLNFGTNKVNLTGFGTGWSYNDTDISLLRWTGTSDPTMTDMSLTGSTDGLIAKGWEIVTNQDIDGASTDGNVTFGARNSTSRAADASKWVAGTEGGSSWWIVSAYFSPAAGSLSLNNDYFKLLSVSGTCISNTTGGACNTPPQYGTPEPGTLALAGLALFAAARVRRAKSDKV